MKTTLIPALVFAICGTTLSAQNNLQDLQASAKPAHASLKTTPAVTKKREPAFYLRKETLKKPLIDREPATERRSASMNSGSVQVKAFPNPFAGELNVVINDATGAELLYEASIYDLQGRKIYTQNLTSKKEKINLSALAGGMYILTVSKNGTVLLQDKLTKE
ncbi:MAG: T9SS type A sorting domain-containing protein [Bacteroidia bacterium]